MAEEELNEELFYRSMRLQRQLARFAGVRPSSISEVVDRLERHGLIERRRDNSDHWVFRLYLTEKGILQ